MNTSFSPSALFYSCSSALLHDVLNRESKEFILDTHGICELFLHRMKCVPWCIKLPMFGRRIEWFLTLWCRLCSLTPCQNSIRKVFPGRFSLILLYSFSKSNFLIRMTSLNIFSVNINETPLNVSFYIEHILPLFYELVSFLRPVYSSLVPLSSFLWVPQCLPQWKNISITYDVHYVPKIDFSTYVT